MELAISEAKRAGDRGDYPIGAVITRLVGGHELVIASAGNRVKTSGSSIKHVEFETLKYVSSGYGRSCLISSFTPRMSPVPCAPVPACGPELARLFTAFPKRTLPLMAASMVRKSASGVPVLSLANSFLRKAITAFLLPAVFCDKNAKCCSVTELHNGNLCELNSQQVSSTLACMFFGH
jgi:hypothetical protein